MSKDIIKGNTFPFKGVFTPPGDKSISHRAVILSSIADGKSNVKGFLKSEDTLSTVNAFKTLGIKIDIKDSQVLISGKGLDGLKKPSGIIDAGNSGTTARLLTGLLSAQPFTSTMTGDKYLKTRPMGRVIKPLTQMEARITCKESEEKLPLTIYGQNLKGIQYRPPIASAQVKSALILAGLYAEGETTIMEPQKTRDHTERMLKHFGVNLDIDQNSIKVTRPKQFKGSELTVPSDISSASFFLVAALINPGSELLIKNVGLNPERVGILEILRNMKGDIQILNEKEKCGEPVGDLLIKSSGLKGIEVKGNLIPKAIDEIPIIAVAACFAEGTTTISDARELRIKETDRIKAMTTELKKLGAEIQELEDGMIIKGKEDLNGNSCESWGDHRIAMAIAIAATKANGEVEINNSDCVKISFPDFFPILNKLRR